MIMTMIVMMILMLFMMIMHVFLDVSLRKHRFTNCSIYSLSMIYVQANMMKL